MSRDNRAFSYGNSDNYRPPPRTYEIATKDTDYREGYPVDIASDPYARTPRSPHGAPPMSTGHRGYGHARPHQEPGPEVRYASQRTSRDGRDVVTVTESVVFTPELGTRSLGFDARISTKQIRNAFIRKVYLLLMTQLIVTFGLVCIFIFVPVIKKWVQDHLWVYLASYFLFLTVFVVLICVKRARRSHPYNLISLGILTLAMAYMCGAIASFHDAIAVLVVLGVTAAVCLTVTLITCQTKFDFTLCVGLMFGWFMVFIFTCLSAIILWQVYPVYLLHSVWGGLFALLFVGILMFDTHRVVGKDELQLDEEEYVYATMQLYVDIVMVFLILLMLFGGGAGDG